MTLTQFLKRLNHTQPGQWVLIGGQLRTRMLYKGAPEWLCPLGAVLNDGSITDTIPTIAAALDLPLPLARRIVAASDYTPLIDVQLRYLLLNATNTLGEALGDR